MGFEKLQMIISEVLGVQAEDVLPEMSFVDDLGADSLEIFQIIMAIDKQKMYFASPVCVLSSADRVLFVIENT